MSWLKLRNGLSRQKMIYLNFQSLNLYRFNCLHLDKKKIRGKLASKLFAVRANPNSSDIYWISQLLCASGWISCKLIFQMSISKPVDGTWNMIQLVFLSFITCQRSEFCSIHFFNSTIPLIPKLFYSFGFCYRFEMALYCISALTWCCKMCVWMTDHGF